MGNSIHRSSVNSLRSAQEQRCTLQNQIYQQMFVARASELREQKKEVYLWHQIYQNTIEIWQIYDPSFTQPHKLNSLVLTDIIFNIKNTYLDFLSSHGFKHKCSQIQQIFTHNFQTIDPYAIIQIFIEWSRKIYQQSIGLFNRSKNKGQTTNTAIDRSVEVSKNRYNDDSYSCTDILVSNRNLCYSYFLDQLTCYYKMNNILDLDFSYLKQLKKRSGKQFFLKPQTLTKAVSNIIDNSTNKQISFQMQKYFDKYYSKYPRKRPIENERKLKASPVLSPLRKRVKLFGQNNKCNASQLLSPKISQFQLLLRPQDSETRMRRLKLMSNNNKFIKNLQLPLKNRRSLTKHQGKLQNSITNLSPSTNQVSHSSGHHLSLQQILKDQRFLRCQSIQSKVKIRDNHYKSPNKDKSISIQNFSNHYNQDIQRLFTDQTDAEYCDNKIKVGRNLQFGDLRVTSRKRMRKYQIQQVID